MTRLTKPVDRIAPDGTVVRIAPEGIYTRKQRSPKWWGPLPFHMVEVYAAKMEAARIVRDRELDREVRKAARGRKGNA